jgi:myo-inositol-1(or 4)-monophosphatase
LTCYFEADLNPWDIAGGALLVKEAGGRMSDINGDDYTLRTRCVMASNGLTHDVLMSTLQEANVLGLDSTRKATS